MTLVTANHCPGAVQFIFQMLSGETYLHCGDMRYATFLQAHLQENTIFRPLASSSLIADSLRGPREPTQYLNIHNLKFALGK